jgi:hypothetical protein
MWPSGAAQALICSTFKALMWFDHTASLLVALGANDSFLRTSALKVTAAMEIKDVMGAWGGGGGGSQPSQCLNYYFTQTYGGTACQAGACRF